MGIFGQDTDPPSAPHTILHIGAGLCQELESWRNAGAKRIVLVEPNSELWPELRHRVGEVEGIEIMPIAISGQAGREALNVFNFPLVSSLRTPTGLTQILPGLTQVGRIMVNTRTINQLLSELELPAGEKHWLVIDAPGEETTIVNQLEQATRLHEFDRIFLRAGAIPCYQESQSVTELAQRLEDAGFRLAGVPDRSDDDWPRYVFVLDRVAVENQQRGRALEQYKQRIHLLSEERERAADELAILKQKLSELQQSSASKIQALESIVGEGEHLRQALSAAREELRQQKSDLGIALRLQALRESDLRELQQRYGEMSRVSEQQRELLGKLHERLSVAAEYLALTDDGDEVTDPIREQLVSALTGKQQKTD